MNNLFNGTDFGFKSLWIFIWLFNSLFPIASCKKKDMNVQQNYPFDVKVMPVPKEVRMKQRVEIRVSILRGGKFKDNQYRIRYFQYDGRGKLQCYNDAPYKPNDLYILPSEEFRLYYTSQSAVTQSFDVWISDDFGNEKQLSFQFDHNDK